MGHCYRHPPRNLELASTGNRPAALATAGILAPLDPAGDEVRSTGSFTPAFRPSYRGFPCIAILSPRTSPATIAENAEKQLSVARASLAPSRHLRHGDLASESSWTELLPVAAAATVFGATLSAKSSPSSGQCNGVNVIDMHALHIPSPPSGSLCVALGQ